MDFLYESDLSLFGGDLLVDLPPPAVELKADQDGLKSPNPTSWQPSEALLQHQDLHNGSPKSAQTGPIDAEWLDTKVDLLDILTEDGTGSLDLFSQLGPHGVDIPEIEAPRSGDAPDSCAAVEVMKSIAEETMQQLQTEEEVVDMNVINAQLLDVLVNSMDTSFDDIMEANLDLPVLSPVSADDVESILSSEPVSPSAVSVTDENSSGYTSQVDFNSFSIPQDAVVAGDLANLLQTVETQPQVIPPTLPLEPQPASRVARTRAKPYEKPDLLTKDTKDGHHTVKELKSMERKLRKKQQNKDAATRYRNKKKAESHGINEECEVLETRNTELKDKVDTMTREIKYLKNLLVEVYQAKGLVIPDKIK